MFLAKRTHRIQADLCIHVLTQIVTRFCSAVHTGMQTTDIRFHSLLQPCSTIIQHIQVKSRITSRVAQFIHVHITYMLCIIPIKRSAVFHVKSIHQVLCRRISSLRAFIAHRFIACFKSACLGSVAAFENQLGRIEQIVITHIQRIAAYFGQVIFIHRNHSSRGFRCLLPFCRLSAWVMERTGCIKQRSGFQSKYGSLRRTTGITPVISMIYRQSIIRNNPVALRDDKVNHRIKRRRFHQIDFFRFISPEQQRNVPITLGKFE